MRAGIKQEQPGNECVREDGVKINFYNFYSEHPAMVCNNFAVKDAVLKGNCGGNQKQIIS